MKPKKLFRIIEVFGIIFTNQIKDGHPGENQSISDHHFLQLGKVLIFVFMKNSVTVSLVLILLYH